MIFAFRNGRRLIFYEKVIKVKADVAAILITFFRAALDLTIEFGTKRNAVQLSFVP